MPFLRMLAPLAMLFALAAPVMAQDSPDDETNAIDDTPHITIVGTAHAEVTPDLATVTLGVVTEKPSARDAAEANARIAQAVIAAAKAQGVGPADLATQSVALTQTFDDMQDASGRFTGRKPRGFQASVSLVIRLRDLAKAGTFVQALIEAGANRFDGIGFSVEHPEPILERLSAEAVGAARREAQGVADAAGVKLGPVLLIERPTTMSGPAPVFARMKVAAAPAMPIEAGSGDLTSAMEVTWAIAR